MSEIAIKIEDLSLIFSLSDSGPKQIFRTFLGPIGKKIFGKGRSFTALRNIDFELRKGEVLGLIGNNGSGKTTLSKKLSEWLPAVHLNADEVRAQADDWDFSATGRIRQASRMIHLAQRVNFEHVILDFVCPKKFIRNRKGR